MFKGIKPFYKSERACINQSTIKYNEETCGAFVRHFNPFSKK